MSPYVVVSCCFVVAVSSAGCSGTHQTGTAPDNTQLKRDTIDGPEARIDRRAEALGLTSAVPRVVVAACRKLGSRARTQGGGHPVYCLPLVPRAASYRIDAAGGLTHGYRDLTHSSVVSVRSATPSESTSHDHWTFAQGEPRPMMGAYLDISHGGSVVQARLAGRRVTIYRMPEGQSFYSGHVVIEWRQGNLVYQVSMHGHRNLERVELMSRFLMQEVARCLSAKSRSPNGGCALVF